MSEQPFDPEFIAHQFAEGIARMRGAMAPLDEATLGYRTQLIGSGWSQEAAEDMAVQFFTMLMSKLVCGA